MFTKGIVLLLCLIVVSVSASYPVPLPPGGRVEVHGWLVLPLDSDLPNPKNPAAPVEAWFSHHVPEFWVTSPHDFQIIVRGHLTPLSVAENITLPLNLPYPPSAEILGNEYTITPPPPFSLNDLLTGKITELLGVFYNGSFDTPYERMADGIAKFTITELTTAVYLNDSTTDVYPTLQYLSYPRNENPYPVAGLQHYYLAHQIHAAPDFDQIVHITIDLDNCVSSNKEAIYRKINTPAAIWSFPSENILENRLSANQYAVGVLLGSDIKCKIHVLEQNHCMVGPGFDINC